MSSTEVVFEKTKNIPPNIAIKELKVSIYKEEDATIVKSEAFDLVSYGETKEEAIKNFTEDLYLFLVTCIELEKLDFVLESLGWERKGKEISPPPYIPEKTENQAEIEKIPMAPIIDRVRADGRAHI